jgi:putative flippase GtrA
MTRFLKFSFVGAIGAFIDFGTFNILNGLLQITSIVAQTISFTAAVTSNFLWNYFWTYPDSRSKPIRRQAIQFASVNLIGLAIRTPIFKFSEGPLIAVATKLLELIPATLPPGPDSMLPIEATILGRNFALALAVIVVLFWNFGINRLWTYSDVN